MYFHQKFSGCLDFFPYVYIHTLTPVYNMDLSLFFLLKDEDIFSVSQV